MPEVYILTGAVHTGKTTAIMQWAEAAKNVFGIITPIVDGRRSFMDVHTGATFEMLAAQDEKSVFEVGRFRFSTKAFEHATDIIANSSRLERGWLVIDECGPLELGGKGFSHVIRQALLHCDMKILLVVRENIIVQVLEYFGLKKDEVSVLNVQTLQQLAK